jgi:hypothetical protein
MVCLPTVVVADPIIITSGSLNYMRNEEGFGILRGAGFATTGLADGGFLFGGQSAPPPGVCSECPIGTLTTASGIERFAFVEFSGAGFSFLGQDYFLVRGRGTFSSEPLVVPRAPEEAFGLVSAPFQFEGFLEGESGGGATVRVDLVGRGTVSLAFTEDDGENVSWFASNYNFSDPAPVPEPASLLMLSAGVAWA